MATGTIDNPLRFRDVISGTSGALPGSTFTLLPGAYVSPDGGQWVCTLSGTQQAPYTFQGQPGARVAGIAISGPDTIWQDVEFAYTGWSTRVSVQSGSAPTDVPIQQALDIYGARTIMRRCTIRDLGNVGLWVGAIDAVFENNLVINQGWDAPDRGHGHSLYTQNQTGTKTIRWNVFAGGYSEYTLHGYTESGSIQGFDVIENVSIGRRMLVGGGRPVDRLLEARNILWGGTLYTGFTPGVQNVSATLVDNILANGATRQNGGIWPAGQPAETGTDTTIGNRIIQYGRNVVVLNQAQVASVAAPKAGRYTNAQNPTESVVLAQGDPLPMSGWTVAAPVAGVGPLGQWDNRFGVFLVA